MPRFSADLYIDGNYVKTYFAEDSDLESAQDRIREKVETEMLIDLEEVDG